MWLSIGAIFNCIFYFIKVNNIKNVYLSKVPIDFRQFWVKIHFHHPSRVSKRRTKLSIVFWDKSHPASVLVFFLWECFLCERAWQFNPRSMAIYLDVSVRRIFGAEQWWWSQRFVLRFFLNINRVNSRTQSASGSVCVFYLFGVCGPKFRCWIEIWKQHYTTRWF